jgi:hypothetical protein
MEHNRGKTNQMDWTHLETQWIREEYDRRKNRGKSNRKPKGQIKKKVRRKKYQELSQLALDRAGWRAAVNQS